MSRAQKHEVLILAALLAAGSLALPTGAAAAPGEDQGEVLARIGDEELTRDEVERGILPQLIDADRQRHQMVENMAMGILNGRLVKREAEERGMTLEQLYNAEIEAKLTPPSPDELTAFKKRHPSSQSPGSDLRIVRQRQRYNEFLADLRDKYDARLLMPAFRVDAGRSAEAPADGPDDAKVVVVEYSDFQCPVCRAAAPTLAQLREEYGDRVRWEYRHFPLRQIHPDAQLAAEASMCADEQEAFWPMHERLFERQEYLSRDNLVEHAEFLELDLEAFEECLASHRYEELVNSDETRGQRLGVVGTPTIFVNGRHLSGARPYEEFAGMIEEELAGDRAP